MTRKFALAVASAGGFGLAAIVVYALSTADVAQVLGVAFLVAAAAIALGGFVGFLFGIPRALTGESSGPPATADAGPTGPRPGFVANTNLEQVSDWLTKIIIGVGLTQLGAIGRGLGRTIDALAPALGGGNSPSARVFAGALTLYCVTLGFLLGWLSTRIALGPALSAADRAALNDFIEAEQAAQAGDEARADELRRLAIRTIGGATLVAETYEAARQGPATPSRTAELEMLMELTRASARSGGWTKERVREWFAGGGDGRRATALAIMQSSPELGDFDSVLDAIAHSHSAFEQYHALVAMEAMADDLTANQCTALREAVAVQSAPGGHLKPTTSRWQVAQRLLARLPAAEPAPTAAAEPA